MPTIRISSCHNEQGSSSNRGAATLNSECEKDRHQPENMLAIRVNMVRRQTIDALVTIKGIGCPPLTFRHKQHRWQGSSSNIRRRYARFGARRRPDQHERPLTIRMSTGHHKSQSPLQPDRDAQALIANSQAQAGSKLTNRMIKPWAPLSQVWGRAGAHNQQERQSPSG